jgi:UDP-glucose 4-epimerase
MTRIRYPVLTLGDRSVSPAATRQGSVPIADDPATVRIGSLDRVSPASACPFGEHHRVLVLGGTGFLGTDVVRAFLEAGCPTKYLARRPPGPDRAAALAPADAVIGDARDIAVLERALEGVDHVVHALGTPHPAASMGDPIEHLPDRLRLLVPLLELLRQHRGVALTFISSGGAVYGNPVALPVPEHAPCDPLTPYGIAKLAEEKYVGMYARLHGLSVRVARVANAYGPRQQPGTGQGLIAELIESARRPRPVTLYGDGEVVRDYVAVGDVARAVVQLAHRSDGPQVVNVGSGVGFSINEVVAAVEAVTGVTLEIDRRPARVFDASAVVLDTARLRALVDWTPILLPEGIARVWEQDRPGKRVPAPHLA